MLSRLTFWHVHIHVHMYVYICVCKQFYKQVYKHDSKYTVFYLTQLHNILAASPLQQNQK